MLYNISKESDHEYFKKKLFLFHAYIFTVM